MSEPEGRPDSDATVTAGGGAGSRGGTAPAVPSRIGPYRLLQKLGEGGMGEVWAAEQEEPVRRRVALKLIRWGMDSREVLARFESERQALALMSHPTIAAIYDAGVGENGRPYFAMEYVEGEPITTYCDRHRLRPRRRLELFRQVCDGVQHAHQKGIIHRDLKPSNVLVTVRDDRPVPKIIDFGVAKATARRLTEKTVFTEFGQLIGTPEYMSPEQAEMTGLDIDTRTDVYSLGALLYELLAGAPPFDPRELRRSGFVEIQRRIREDEPLRPSTRVTRLGDTSAAVAGNRQVDAAVLARRLRGDLDWIVMKALEKDRTRRYASASELAEELGRHLRDEPVLAGPPSAAYRARKFVRRHWGVVVTAMLVALALVAGTVGTTLGLLRALRAERLAQTEAETTRQVSDFMVELFRVSDPSEARGNEITAREILDRGVERIRTSLTDQPLVQARLMDAMGTVYRGLGLVEEAGQLLEEALEIRTRQLGEAAPEVAGSLMRLGIARWDAGEYDDAERLLRRALAIREDALGPESPEVATSVNYLGIVLETVGRYDEAEALLRRALALRERALGPEHADVARTLNSLGVLLMHQAKYADAEPYYERALAIKEKTLGPDHPSIASSLNNLAILNKGLGRLDRAEELYRRSAVLKEKTLGPEHPHVGDSFNNLGIVQREKGQTAAAESSFLRALEIWEQALGPDHADVAIALGNLASVYYDRGDYAEAEARYARAVTILEDQLGPDHPWLAANLGGLAAVYREQGRLDESESLFRRAMAVQESVLDAAAPELAETREEYAALLERMGRSAEAEGLAEK